MRYLALACDYDGTLATHGIVEDEVIAALERVRASGRSLILVTGRELEDLLDVFPHVELFERVVAENGALLYCPASHEEKVLGEPPPESLVDALRQRSVAPLSVGRSIVATWHPHETTVIEIIRDLGLEHQVVFNKGAVMILPPGVNKGTGLATALNALALSPHNTVGIGDAENDHAFLSLCECSVAVANALPTLQERADIVTTADHGRGVVELVEQLLEDDLRQFESRLRRHSVMLGTREDGQEVCLKPYGMTVLLAGPSGSGKSTASIGVLERLAERGYQFCLVDPEGDYDAFDNAVALGDNEQAPTVAEILQLLKTPGSSAIVNLVGIPLHDRPAFFSSLLPHLQETRGQTGRPHWLVVDEAHHLLPREWDGGKQALPHEPGGMMFITVHPDHVNPAVLAWVDVVVAVGERPHETLGAFCAALGESPPPTDVGHLESGEVLAWFRRDGAPPVRVHTEPARIERRRHRRKYAAGDLGPRSFFFQGPEGKLNLRAQNLALFMQIAEGVDDATWLHHLRQGDYSRWFRDAIKDEALASEAEHVERMTDLSAAESRERIKQAIDERYSAAA